MRVVSKLTAKARTSIPRAVREERLGLRPGDGVVREPGPGGGARPPGPAPAELACLRAVQATLAPAWGGPEDDEAHAGL